MVTIENKFYPLTVFFNYLRLCTYKSPRGHLEQPLEPKFFFFSKSRLFHHLISNSHLFFSLFHFQKIQTLKVHNFLFEMRWFFCQNTGNDETNKTISILHIYFLRHFKFLYYFLYHITLSKDFPPNTYFQPNLQTTVSRCPPNGP